MVVAAAGEGDGLTELLGLKKSASVFLAGDGDGGTVGETAAVVFPLRACFAAGGGGGCWGCVRGGGGARGRSSCRLFRFASTLLRGRRRCRSPLSRRGIACGSRRRGFGCISFL